MNWLAAGLLAFTIFFYAVVYTMWLKRSTAQNIVIGGAAGALPPVIGWAAATGSLPLEPVLLFAIIFLWTPPHFWALSLYRTDDYARAEAADDAGGRRAPTRRGCRSCSTRLRARSRCAVAPLAARLPRSRPTASSPLRRRRRDARSSRVQV